MVSTSIRLGSVQSSASSLKNKAHSFLKYLLSTYRGPAIVLGAGCWVLEQDGEQGRLDPSQQLPCATGEIRHQTKEYGIANPVCPTKWFSTFSYFLKWKLPTYTSVQKILSDNFLSKSFWVKNCNYQSEFLINKRSHSHPTVKITLHNGEKLT